MNEYGKQVKKTMDTYMNNPDSIDKEISDIQNATHGVEVRGALAAGVKKSFTKSKHAEDKSNEAYDITQNLLDETFDSALLEQNFEQRLDNEIQNLQPEWTQFRTDVTSQLERIAVQIQPSGDDDTLAIQTAIDAGYDVYLVSGEPYRITSDLKNLNGQRIFGNLFQATIVVDSLNGFGSIENPNVKIENVIIDFNNNGITSYYGISLKPGAHNFELNNVTLENMGGSDETTSIQLQYGLMIDLDNVKNFKLKNVKFKNISNYKHAGNSNLYFSGGIYFGRDFSRSVIPFSEQSSGHGDLLEFHNIYTRYPDGTTIEEKQVYNDADAIRGFSANNPLHDLDIRLTNLKFSKIGKRCIKVTECGGMEFDRIFVDGTERPDDDVPMLFVADFRSSSQTIKNVKAVFGDKPATNGIIIERSYEKTVVKNVDIDHIVTATIIDSNENEVSNVIIDDVRGKSARGLFLGRSQISNSVIKNVNVESTNGQGITIDNCNNIILENTSILNGDLAIWQGSYKLKNVTVKWNTITNMPQRVVTLVGENTEVDMEVYLPEDSTQEAVRLNLKNSRITKLHVESGLGRPLHIRNCEDISVDRLRVKSLSSSETGNVWIGGGTLTDDVFIDKIEFDTPNLNGALIRFESNVPTIIIKTIYAPKSNRILKYGSTANQHTHIFENVYWENRDNVENIAAPGTLPSYARVINTFKI